jgi:hypothetical protein
MLYSIFWVIPQHLNFNVSEHTVCSIFIGCVNKGNEQDEIARLLIQVKVWLILSLGQSEGEGWGGGMSE